MDFLTKPYAPGRFLMAQGSGKIIKPDTGTSLCTGQDAGMDDGECKFQVVKSKGPRPCHHGATMRPSGRATNSRCSRLLNLKG